MNPDQTLQLWFHYEEIAMHFNELIIQYRLQLMGGTGLIGALSGYLVGSKVESAPIRQQLRAYISTGILILVCAAASLDVFYYNELLRGASKALLRFESEHPEIYMSTYIKAQFDGGASIRIYIIYAMALLPLIGFTIWSWRAYLSGRATN